MVGWNGRGSEWHAPMNLDSNMPNPVERTHSPTSFGDHFSMVGLVVVGDVVVDVVNGEWGMEA